MFPGRHVRVITDESNQDPHDTNRVGFTSIVSEPVASLSNHVACVMINIGFLVGLAFHYLSYLRVIFSL